MHGLTANDDRRQYSVVWRSNWIFSPSSWSTGGLHRPTHRLRRGHVFTRRLTAVPVQVVHCSGCDQWLAWVDGLADVGNASNFVLLQLMMMMQSVHVARLRLDKLQYVQTHLTALQHVTVSR